MQAIKIKLIELVTIYSPERQLIKKKLTVKHNYVFFSFISELIAWIFLTHSKQFVLKSLTHFKL